MVNYVSSIVICLPASQVQIKQFVAQYTRTRKTFNKILDMIHPIFVLAIGRIEIRPLLKMPFEYFY